MENAEHKAVAGEHVEKKKRESTLRCMFVYVLEEYETTNETASSFRAQQ